MDNYLGAKVLGENLARLSSKPGHVILMTVGHNQSIKHGVLSAAILDNFFGDLFKAWTVGRIAASGPAVDQHSMRDFLGA
ncbi:MAG: hypothetical protein AAFX06_19005 [Planctomycetota bacterium]